MLNYLKIFVIYFFIKIIKNFSLYYFIIVKIKQNFESIFFYIVITMFVIFYFFLLNFFLKRVHFFFAKFKNLYFFNYFDVLNSSLVIMLFIYYYIIILRVMIMVSDRNINLNFFFLKDKLYYYSNIFNIFYFFILLFFAKLHYLKLHYYFFYRITFYVKFLEQIQSFEEFKVVYLGIYYKYYCFFRLNFFKFVFVCLFFKAIVLDKGDLTFFIKFLPYYGLYHFSLNIYLFIIKKIKFDFDFLILESYYKNIYYFNGVK